MAIIIVAVFVVVLIGIAIPLIFSFHASAPQPTYANETIDALTPIPTKVRSMPCKMPVYAL